MKEKGDAYLYEFGSFRLDPVKRILWRGSEAAALTSRAFDTLLILVQNFGETVEKEVLIEKVWGDTVVEENNLTQCISALRKALGDDRSERRFIVTFAGRGYRFVADVKKSQVDPPAASSLPQPAATNVTTGGEYSATPASTPRANVNRIVSRVPVPVKLAVIGGIAAILAEVLWSPGGMKHHAKPLAPTQSGASALQNQRTMLAVLPFENLTGNPRQDYFSDGLTEEIINRLGRLDADHLGIIARTSVMRYKHDGEGIHQIAAELGVNYILEGSVRQSGDQLRISTQLIRVSDRTHLWAKSYQGTARNAFALQEEVAKDIQAEIERRLSFPQPDGSASPPHVHQPRSLRCAKDLYLFARMDSSGHQTFLQPPYLRSNGNRALSWAGTTPEPEWTHRFC